MQSRGLPRPSPRQMDERLAGQLTLLSFYCRYVIAETLTLRSPPEHKIGIFVRFCPSEPPFSGFSSTKRAFLCQKWQLFPGFGPFRAQNRGFCALFAFETPVFGLFEHKIGIFVSETAIFPWFWLLPSTKSAFLCAFVSKFLPDGTTDQQQTSFGGEDLRFG